VPVRWAIRAHRAALDGSVRTRVADLDGRLARVQVKTSRVPPA